MKRFISVIVLLGMVIPFAGCTPYHTTGTAGGAAVGGVAGAVIDSRNPWRGGVIGGVLGAILGATLADVSYKASREAAYMDRPVEYTTEDGRGVYRAEPMDYDAQTRCHKVHEKVWEDGRLVRDTVKEVCEGDKRERRY